METLIYLGKVNLCWVVLYLSYRLLLHRQTFFVWNRTYLLVSLVLAALLPFVQLPEKAPVFQASVYVAEVVPVYMPVVITPETTHFPWISLIWIIMLLVSAFMLARLLRQLLDLRTLVQRGDKIEFEDYTLILLPDNNTGSFSFLKRIVINRADYENNLDMILAHEMVHVCQRHSLDILFVELLKVICWFNPVLWFYKNSLQEVHEYLADQKAPEREDYTTFMVSYALNAPVRSLTNHFFNSSLLKNRITMIYKNRTSRWFLGKYLVLIPVTAMVVLLTAAREHITEKMSSSGNGVYAKRVVSAQNFKSNSNKSAAARAVEFMDIKGSVKDEAGNSVPNVILVEKGATRGVNTDLNGNFEFKDVRVNSTIAVSHVSFIPFEFVVEKTRTDYQIKLKKGQNLLEGAVVVAFIKQNADSNKLKNKEIKGGLKVIEQQPEFPGGITEMWKFIGRNTRYPAEASKAGVQGKALISFTVNENGNIRNPKVIQGLGAGIDEEAIRMVLSMPSWTPAKQNGQAIAVEYTLPIEFKLEYENKEKQQGFFAPSKMPFYETLAKSETEFAARQSNALIIVDGIRQPERGNAAFENIPTEDIAGITVLKDPSALAVYGHDGRNGVVLINTKSSQLASHSENNNGKSRYNNYKMQYKPKNN